STTLFRGGGGGKKKKKLFLDPRVFDADTLVMHRAGCLSGIYRSILRAVTEEGSRLKKKSLKPRVIGRKKSTTRGHDKNRAYVYGGVRGGRTRSRESGGEIEVVGPKAG
ncbi:hypothetical protein ALC56_06721, partial [Trachymyrmex septentrionalis]